MSDASDALYDVVAVNIKNGQVRVLAVGKTLSNAEAISNMAVIRRGCDTEFYKEVPSGTLQTGDRIDL
jgi:hypothetical protein